MAIDDEVYKKTVVHLLRAIIDLQTTVTAIGLAMKDRGDDQFEGDVGVHRAALLKRAAPVLAMFERAEAADILAMLQQFNRPPQ